MTRLLLGAWLAAAALPASAGVTAQTAAALPASAGVAVQTATALSAPAGVTAQTATALSAAEVAFFESQVRPLLVRRCYECHSQQAGKHKGGLFLDSRQGWQKGGDSGPAVVPGAPERSLLVKAIGYRDPDLQMPPDDPLPPGEVRILEEWVRRGAPDPRDAPAAAPSKLVAPGAPSWAFGRLTRPPLPAVKTEGWARNEIDSFVLAALEARGLAPSSAAEPGRLVRRMTLDLTGLPPAGDEVKGFLAAPTPAAYDALVDRRLADRHFGERWARHWLDVARFAESFGFEQDTDRPDAYPYRDFVVRAFNEDLPYDRFVSWQIAGDELAPETPQALVATGFLGAGPFPTQLTEAEFESARYDELDDMVATIGTAFLGLTVGCARCHDHKFDPIASRDYYRLAATFTKAIRTRAELDLGPEAHAEAKRRHEAEEARLVAARDATAPGSDARKSAEKRLAQHRQQEPAPGLTPVMIVTEGRKPLPHLADERGFPHFYSATYVLKRGDVHAKLGIATPGMLPLLTAAGTDETRWRKPPPPGATTSQQRAALARWLVDPERGAGALVARVIVNRLWQQHLGQGLVATPNDFGRQGAPPSNRALLDYLASTLIANGWRLKPIHRLILTSATYRQSAADRPEARAADPDNTLVWRWTPRRLEAEAIRDVRLAIAGRLDDRPYGPGTLADDQRRRSLYFTVKRSQLVPAMQLFDAPDALTSLGQRSSTIVAPQALHVLNAPQVRADAGAFAALLAPAAARSWADAVEEASWRALGRPPDDDERAAALVFLRDQTASYRGPTRERRRLALTDYCQALFALSELITME